MIAKTLNIRSFVAKTHLLRFTFFSDNKCPLFAHLGGGGRRKGQMSPFFYRFSYSEASLISHYLYNGEHSSPILGDDHLVGEGLEPVPEVCLFQLN